MFWSVVVLLLIALAGAAVLGVILAFAGKIALELTRSVTGHGRRERSAR